MFTGQSFTENKAVISRETVQILFNILAEIEYIKKSIRYEMQHLVQIA